MAHLSGGDLGDEFTGPNGTCYPSEWVTGVIVPDESGRTAIRNDRGRVRWIMWGAHNPAVIDWNRRYTIGGNVFNSPDSFWACGGADSVIPQ